MEQVMSRSPPNPTGKGGFKPGQSGNPFGRPRKQIANLGAEARKWSNLALDYETLVQICKGEMKQVTPRDRLAAANALLDRGYGKPTQAIDIIMLGKKISELSTAELIELNSRLAAGNAGDAEHPPVQELN
jgi:Family of unknown function (DUF5681)